MGQFLKSPEICKVDSPARQTKRKDREVIRAEMQ